MKVKLGDKFKWLDDVYHVIGIIEDNIVVLKRWSRNKKRWVYSAEEGYVADLRASHHSESR